MRFCKACNNYKDPSDFHKNSHHPDGLQKYCKRCLRHMNNANQYRKRKVVHDYLESHPCVDCAEKDPVVLDLDHVRGTKLKAVSFMVSNSWSILKILEELPKCEVRCANCHRRKTAKERGYYRWKEDPSLLLAVVPKSDVV